MTYTRYLKNWIRPRWGSFNINEIDSIDVEPWLHGLEAACGTKVKIRNIMSALFRHAMRYRFVERSEYANPIKYVRQSLHSDIIPVVLNSSQVWAIIARLRQPVKTMAFVDAFTGLRISELLALKWGDVDIDNLQLHVSRAIVYGVVGGCKSKASKKPVPLDRALCESLLTWKQMTVYNRLDDWIFASGRLNGQKPLNPGMLVRHHLQPAATEAGVKGRVGWHTFRRTLASRLIANGEDIKVVQESLRHASSKISLDLYAQATTPGKRAAQSS